MTTRKIGMEHWPLHESLTELLDEADPVDQQIAIEMLMARHAMRIGPEHGDTIIDGMTKHAKQMSKLHLPAGELIDGMPSFDALDFMRAVIGWKR